MTELQDITDAWGHWLASRSATTLDFTASTDYSGKSDDYKKYEVKVKPLSGSLRFGSSKLVNSTIGFEDSKLLRNDSSSEQTIEASFGYERVDTFKWLTTEALKIGVIVKGSVEVPLLARAEASATTEISLSSAQETTKVVKKTVSIKLPVKVAPHKKILANANSMILEYNSDWEMSTLLTGFVAIKFNDYRRWSNFGEINKLWFIPIETALSDVIYHSITDASGYQVVNGGIHAIARGTCSTLFGNKIDINIKEGELNDDLKLDG